MVTRVATTAWVDAGVIMTIKSIVEAVITISMMITGVSVCIGLCRWVQNLLSEETPEDVENWIRSMVFCLREFRCSEEQKMDTLDFLVEGRAQRWWRSASAHFITPRGVATWEEFRTAFHKLYFSLDLRQAKASELLGLWQGSMSIDEYHLNFFESLPYYPQIPDSTEAKYNLFLQDLNPEIHDRVAVGDDMTYDGLVSQCHQAEDSIRRNKSFLSSIPASSLGPRTQSFKNYVSNSSSSGSGDLMRFGRRIRDLVDIVVGIILPTGSSSQASVQQRPQGQYTKGSNLKPRASSQVFAMRHDQAVDENGKVIAGMFLLFDIPAFPLIDTCASHSFISARFVKRYKFPYISLDSVVVVSTPTGQSVLAKRLVLGCPLDFEGNVLMENLMIL
ncbi:uncharacterized protein [Henckelia pumila]|uniref:uncharacterized protein n=1 Tax=Henckelia pumila TaxID=405737 RepID=UPI003C6E5723